MRLQPAFKLTNITTARILLLGLFVLLAGVVVATVLLGSVPPVSRDALTHHLFVPKLYLEHGAIYEIPEIPFSYYPMNLDLLYIIPLYFGNDIIPKYIHFFFALLTSWLIFNYLKSRTNSRYALLGSLFFLSIPIIIKLSITVYVDLGLVFFTTASLLLLFRWLNSGYQSRYLILAGICCGLAAGTKYNGLINIFLLTLFLPILYIRSQSGRSGSNRLGIAYGMLFFMTSLLTFSPWLIRNYAWTGNPIYPLHNSLFQQNINKNYGTEGAKETVATDAVNKLIHPESSIFVSRKIIYHETLWQTVLLPLRFFFEGRDDNPRYFDGKLNPFLLILTLFAFLKKSSDRSLQLEKFTLFGFSILFFFLTFFQESMRVRYVVCIVPPMVLLSIYGLQNIFDMISEAKSIWLRRGAIIISSSAIATMLFYNASYIAEQFWIVRPISYISGTVARDSYISQFRPEFKAISYANSLLQPKDKVLCLFLGNRGYYMNFTPIFDKPFKSGLIANILTSQLPKNSLKNALHEKEINYILLRNDLTQYSYQQLNVTNKKAIAAFFQNDTEKLISAGGYTLLGISKN